jgi:hypothetical protein
MKTKEERLESIIPNDDYWQNIFPKVITIMQEYAEDYNEAMNEQCMEEESKLFKESLPLQEPITQPMPRDTDLENAAREYADKNGYGDYGLIYRTYLKGAMELRDKLQSLPVVPSEITDVDVFDILSILSVDKDGHITGKNEAAKELYSLFKQSLPREDNLRKELIKNR